jgi:Adenylate and Guanylate cyclase catalytic domain
VNTASRVESNGIRDKIQVSQATADLLVAAGKSSWLKKRDDLIEAKGKGTWFPLLISHISTKI